MCCWKTCFPCQGQNYTSAPDQRSCQTCGDDEVANHEHTACLPVQWTFHYLVSLPVIALATIGLVVTVVTGVLFLRHRNSLVVKTSDFTLSLIMLTFHGLSFLSTLTLLVKPSKTICLVQILLVLPWPVLCVGCLLVKTNRLRVLFRQTTKLSKTKRFLLSNKTQVVLVCSLGVLMAVFVLAWVTLFTPGPRITFRNDHAGYVCDIDSAWMAIFFGGFLSLLIVSLLLAISSRNVPSDFNDASSLLMSAATITSLWIILVPAYYVSTSVPSSNLLALIITSQGMASFLFLFSRRLFYLVRPMSEEKMKARKMFARWSSAEQKHDKAGAAGGANSSSSSEVACQEQDGKMKTK